MYLSVLASCSALAARQTSGGPRGQPASILCSMDGRLTNGCMALVLVVTCMVSRDVFRLRLFLLFSCRSFFLFFFSFLFSPFFLSFA